MFVPSVSWQHIIEISVNRSAQKTAVFCHSFCRTIADLISKARFFEDERYDMQRPDLEGRLEETTLDGSVRMQFRFAIQQTVRTLWSALPMFSFVESDWLSRQARDR
jgi:hypothetical protein